MVGVSDGPLQNLCPEWFYNSETCLSMCELQCVCPCDFIPCEVKCTSGYSEHYCNFSIMLLIHICNFCYSFILFRGLVTGGVYIPLNKKTTNIGAIASPRANSFHIFPNW